MSFTRSAAALLAFLLVLNPGTAGPKSSSTYRKGMAFRGAEEIDGKLVVMEGAIGPSSFFENLRSVDSKDGTVFLNDVGKVLFFPDRMTITLVITGPIPRVHKAFQASGFDAEYMKGLKFRAEWKHGIEPRPVKAFRQLTVSVEEPLAWAGIRECWIYEFVLEDTEVPISDHLVLFIHSPQDKRIARLSAYL